MKKLLIVLLLLVLPAAVQAEDVTLKWSESPSDILGYNIYYKTGTPGPPYDVRINISDPNATQYTIQDVDPNQAPYYFVGTSYSEYRESDYTPEVMATKKDIIQPLPQNDFGIAPRKFKEVTETVTETMTKTTMTRTVE